MEISAAGPDYRYRVVYATWKRIPWRKRIKGDKKAELVSTLVGEAQNIEAAVALFSAILKDAFLDDQVYIYDRNLNWRPIARKASE